MPRSEQGGDKLQGGEIRVKEREHGKVYRWFDNFWYHHKWKTIIALFLVVVILVCVLQLCEKEEDGDITVLLAGPYGFSDEATYNNLRNALSLSVYLKDYDGNGASRADLVTYTLYSAAQIEALRVRTDENGNPDPVEVSTISNTKDYNAYNQYLMTGDTSVLFLDPWLFEELAAKGEYLADLVTLYGAAPEGAVSDPTGGDRCLGVRLADTALYRDHNAVQVLPADTVLCLLGPYFVGKSSNEKEYAKAVEYFGALVGVQ